MNLVEIIKGEKTSQSSIALAFDFVRQIRKTPIIVNDSRNFYANRSAPVSTLLSLMAHCYYRDDRVLQAIGQEPRAPHPKGYVVEQGDWGLLEPVKQRGKIYRDV